MLKQERIIRGFDDPVEDGEAGANADQMAPEVIFDHLLPCHAHSSASQ